MRRSLEDYILGMWQGQGVISDLLLPLSKVYGCISRHKVQSQAKNAWRAPVPVIVIGNIIVGGTGKTPVTLALCKALQQAGWQPGIISRGYGVKIKGHPHISDIKNSGDYLGDEPSLLHQQTGVPVAVHPKRALAAKALLQAHKDINVLISDDGLQHMALARDIEIIVQDERKLGNGRLLPAGPLREHASRLTQADFIINNCTANFSGKYPQAEKHTNLVNMWLKPQTIKHLQSGQETNWDYWFEQNHSNEFNAIAGIGQPDRFFKMLSNHGLKLKQQLAIGDHKKISQKTLNSMDNKAILITAKDASKCLHPYDKRLNVVYPDTVFDNHEWLSKIINRLNIIIKK